MPTLSNVPEVHHIGHWQVRTMGRMVLAVLDDAMGEDPSRFTWTDDQAATQLDQGSLWLPFEVGKAWGDGPIGQWFTPGAYGSVTVGFIRPTSHRDIGCLWPRPFKLPITLTLNYDR